MTDPARSTLRAYEEHAVDWVARRTAELGPAGDFADWVTSRGDTPGPVLDLGCGPGWHLPALPAGTVALDAAAAMLRQVHDHAPDAPRVRADLRSLPFARGSLGGAWAERSLVHLARREVPMALWDLHRAVRVGGGVHLGLFGGDLEHGRVDGDDLPGRWFSAWPDALLGHVLEGAGFTVELVEPRPDGEVDHLRIWARRAHTLADTVAPGMRLLLVGLNPSLVSADAGVPYQRRGNRAWPALLAAGLATVDRDPEHLLRAHRIGMTDLVKRATPRADALSADEYRHGVARVEALCSWLQPAAVCVVGLGGWRAAVDPRATAGVQGPTLGGRPVYLMPSTSGVNAHVGVDELAEHFREAARLADAEGAPADSDGAPA